MSLAAVFRSAFAAAHAATAGLQVSLQADVSHEAWIGQDVLGEERFAPAVLLRGLVQMDPELTPGQETNLLAIVAFLEPVPPNPADGRQGPVDTRDRLILPDGRTGPIVKVQGGMVDNGTNLPFALQIKIGRG